MNRYIWMLLAAAALLGSSLHAGNLKVNLAPTQAVNAGAQWRVDGGIWKNSGTTANGLSNGTHTVTFKAVSGWIEPAATNVTITNGNTTRDFSYTQAASLKATLSPGVAQWRVDGGVWRASGATAADMAPGAHLVDYAPLSGYTAPASESVTLTAGQLLSINRSYVQLAQVTVTLTPGSGQWRIDGGTWPSSGATAVNLAPGSHAIDYAALAGYAAPAPESVSLVAGQTLPLQRNYTQLAQIQISLVPVTGQWRADGGAWQSNGSSILVLPGNHPIEYASLADCDPPANETVSLAAAGVFATTRYYVSTKPTLQINLAPNTGQWRVDGGAWQANGAVVVGLAAGSHTIDFTDVGGTYNPLPSKTVSLSLRENATLARSYPLKPLASLNVSFSPVGVYGQWRLNGGDWQYPASFLNNLPYDVPHTVEFSAIEGYVAPPPQTFTLASGEQRTLTATYTPLASLNVSFNPVGVYGQWRLNGGDWQYPASFLNNLPYDVPHTVEFSAIEGYVAPPPQTFTLASGEQRTLTATYTPLASLNVSFNPVGVYGQWRLNSGDWQYPASFLNNLPYDVPHTVEFSAIEGYVAPPPQTFTLASGEQRTLTATYTPLASLNVSFNPVGVYGQWRLNSGDWQYPASFLNNLPYDVPHTVEFSAIEGYVAPPPQTFTLASGEQRTLTATYTPLASLNVSFNPVGVYGQWRLNGGDWQYPASFLNNLPYDVPHTVEFSAIEGYVAPPPQTFTLASGEQRTLTATYTPLASLNVSFSPVGIDAQWRFIGTNWWYPSTTTLNNIFYDVPYTIEFSAIEGYVAPPPQTFTLASGEQRTLTATYTPLASLNVSFSPVGIDAQWRFIGTNWWYPSTTTLNNIFYDVPYTIEFSAIEGYVAPPPQTFTLASGEQRTLTATYTFIGPGVGQLTVTLTPASGQWRIDSGAWQASGATIDFDSGTHSIEYNVLPGMVGPAAETISLFPDQHLSLDRDYTVASYVATHLNHAPGHGGPSVGLGINLAGMIAGRTENHAFRYANGVIQDLGTLAGFESTAYGLNDIGVVVGESTHSGGGSFRAFLHDGTMHDLGALSTTDGGGYSQALAINASGVAVGRSGVGSSPTHAFRYSGGVMEDLGTLNPGYGSSTAHAINDAGVIVGYSDLSPGEGRAFRYSGGIMQNLGTLGGTSSAARALNESGVIVGESSLAVYGSHAFRYSNGVMIDLGTLEGPQGSFSRAQGINEAGDIVGVSSIAGSGLPHAFIVYSGGAMQDLNTLVEPVPGVYFYDSFGINDLGQIVASGSNGSAYLLTLVNAPGGLQVNVVQAAAQWRVDGGPWQTSGSSVLNLAIGDHLIEYSEIAGYARPSTEVVAISSGRLLQLNRSYNNP